MQTFLIVVDQQLDEEWRQWLGGADMAHRPDGTTQLTCRIQDQAALYGLLVKLRDLGISLLSIEPQGFEDKDSNQK